MNEQRMPQLEIEPERYELHEPRSFTFELDRRDFCKALGGGIVIAIALGKARAQESGGGRRQMQAVPKEIGAWIHIAQDGKITVYTGKVEVGQDIRTSLSQVVAEELKVPVASVTLIMGDTDSTPYDMGTFGSMTTRVMSPQLRKAAASARSVLIELAAARFKADATKLAAVDGKIADAQSGKSATYGELAEGQRITKTIGDDVALTPADRWQVAGKPALKIGARDIVTGLHQYPSDIKRPGMLYGKILRAPAANSTLVSVDLAKTEAMPGIVTVRDAEFVGVAAQTSHAASQALSTIRAEWKTPPQPSSKELFDYLKKNVLDNAGRGGERGSSFTTGSIEQGLSGAAHRLNQAYTVAYIAHVPLEPRAAVAEWVDGKLTVWVGTQRPFGVRSELAQVFRIPEERVRVIMPDMGSGYGGKHTGEVAIEAARLAKAAGKPVKVVWTREEEFAWAYFRPAGVIEISSGISADGMLTAWEFHNYNSGGAAIRSPYESPNQKIEFHATKYPLRQGSYRGLAATANNFARESHIDELCALAKVDPLEFRLRSLKDQRLRAVLQAAAEKFGWGKTGRQSGRGFGIACGVEKGGYVATCAEVAIDNAGADPKLLRVVTAFDCGAVVNPEGLKNQIEGAVIMGLGGALFESVEFENGKLLNGRLSQYRVPRFGDVPQLETVLIDRRDLPTAGAGETPIIAVAPAISNAIVSAGGKRLRSLPMFGGQRGLAETGRS